MTNEWTEARVETLRTLWAKGYTARQIAEELGGPVTRNAVIGKAHRLGLSSRQETIKKKVHPDYYPNKLEKNCQWPIGEPGEDNFHFCKDKTIPGRPYCQTHCAVAYRRLSIADAEAQTS